MSFQSTTQGLILSKTKSTTSATTSDASNTIVYPGAQRPETFCYLADPSILSVPSRDEDDDDDDPFADGENSDDSNMADECANEVTKEMPLRPQIESTEAQPILEPKEEVESNTKPESTGEEPKEETPNAETKENAIANDNNTNVEADAEANGENEVQAEMEDTREQETNVIESDETTEDTETQQDPQIEEAEEQNECPWPNEESADSLHIDDPSTLPFPSTPSTQTEFSLEFKDFVDVQTRLVLMPFIEEEGKGAIVASFPEDDKFQGLVLASIDRDETQDLQAMDFTDILSSLREHSVPICLRFEAANNIEEEHEEDGKELMVDVDIGEKTEILEEKKDDDCGESITPAEDQNPKAETPKATNHTEHKNHEKHGSDDNESGIKVETSTLSPKPTYLEKRQSSTPREHTRSLNSILDDHRNTNGDSNSGHGRTLSSGMFALSAWGMRMKAQSEKLLATAGAKASQQAQKQQPQKQQPQRKSSSKSSANESNSQQLPCDMYLQTNLGTYFPISKYSKSNGPQHVQAVTTSSLYCIRKSATEPCTVGRDTMYKNNAVRYSFQWYRSSSRKKSSRDRFPISPKTLYSKDNFDDESIGDSTLTSKRSRTYSSADSESSSCSSWSESSASSSSYSSYSMSTAGVTQHTFSVASLASGANTTVTKTTKDMNREIGTTSWIPLKGATGATFQPNTTLVGKKLRCVVTIRPSRGSSSDEDSNAATPRNSPKSGAIMDADDFDTNTNDVSVLEDDNGEFHRSLLQEEKDEGVEKIVCDLAVPIQADMILFNGARQAMAVKGSASFGNLVGRGNAASANTPATATSACSKVFRIEVGTTRKIVLYTPPPSVGSTIPKPQRRFVNVNVVHIYCRASPQDEYERLTDTPLYQVTARANPTNSKHVDLLFPAIPPSKDENGKDDDAGMKSCTLKFLSEYCVMDHASSSESGVPRLELEAPNRMTRESFLLALGIANFRGRTAQLDNKKVLYRDDEPVLSPSRNPSQQQNDVPISTTPSMDSPPSKISQSEPTPPQSPPEQAKEPKATEQKKESNGGSDLKKNGEKSDGKVISGHLALSPCRPSDVISEPKNVLSPISCQSNAEVSQQRSEPIIPFPEMPSEAEAHLARIKQLERETAMLRATLARRDQIISDLALKAKGAEDALQKTRRVLANTRQELKQSQEDCERIQISKRHVERSMQMEYEATQTLEANHKSVVTELESKLSKQADKIADLEKQNRSLQNEKAVLGATVEARESKLVKLEELQISNSELSKKVAQQGVLETQLEESHKKHERLQAALEDGKKTEAECKKELGVAKKKLELIQKRMKGDQEKASTWQSQMDAIQKKNQLLKGERNSYKQKNESLSKEVARLCRGGKNIRDIEKVLADHESLVQETELLRAQKRKALEEAHKYRISYEQAKAAEEALALKPDERETRRILERTAELERLLAEMTDYVTAKQMQLDTLKEVNEELQREIHSLARANLRNDEI